MSDVNIIIDVNSNNGNIVVQHVCESILITGYDIMRTISYYEVLVDGVLKHKSNEPEDIMRALGHYLVGGKT